MAYITVADLGKFPKGKFIHQLNLNYSHGRDDELALCGGPVEDTDDEYYVLGKLYIKYSHAKAKQNPKGIVSKISWQDYTEEYSAKGLRSGDVNKSRYYIWEDGPDSYREIIRGYICAIFDRLQDGRP